VENRFEIRGGAGSWTVERVAFVQKVYALLTLTILAAAGGGMLAEDMSIATAGPMSLAAFVVLIIGGFVRRVPVLNVAMLGLFAVLEGMSAGPILSYLAGAGMGDVVVKALVITFATFLGLTLYVLWSKQDFSWMGGFLLCALLGMLVTSLVGLFTGMSAGFSLIYAYFGVLVFVGYVLYDTSNLIHHDPPDEYIAATMALFLDILNLFWFILRILISQDRD
jgi:modulator of FtsH protease